MAIYAGKAAGAVKSAAGGAVHAAGDVASSTRKGYESYQTGQAQKSEERQRKAEEAQFNTLRKRWEKTPHAPSSNLEQKMREDIARANIQEEQTHARELKAKRKRVRNLETEKSLERRQAKVAGRKPVAGGAAGQPSVMDILEGRSGPGQGLDEVNRRLKGFF